MASDASSSNNPYRPQAKSVTDLDSDHSVSLTVEIVGSDASPITLRRALARGASMAELRSVLARTMQIKPLVIEIWDSDFEEYFELTDTDGLKEWLGSRETLQL